jgi:hypothetical protein
MSNLFANREAGNSLLLEHLTCSVSDNGLHFVLMGKVLSCGHPVCPGCVPYSNGIGLVCGKCERPNQNDVIEQEPVDFSSMVRANMGPLKKILLNEMNKSIEICTGKPDIRALGMTGNFSVVLVGF